MPRQSNKCDSCKLTKTPIIYIRMSRKLCSLCWQAERESNKSLIATMMHVIPWDAPLGYNFVMDHWYIDQTKGRKMADAAFEYLGSATS